MVEDDGAMPSARSVALRAEPVALSQAKPTATIARESGMAGTDIIAEALFDALKALRGNIGCASLVRNPVGIKLREQADAALAKAQAAGVGAR